MNAEFLGVDVLVIEKLLSFIIRYGLYKGLKLFLRAIRDTKLAELRSYTFAKLKKSTSTCIKFSNTEERKLDPSRSIIKKKRESIYVVKNGFDLTKEISLMQKRR
jgi:hypothetical protein